MPAGHGIAFGVLVDQGTDIPRLIGPWTIDLCPHQGQQNEAGTGYEHRKQKIPAGPFHCQPGQQNGIGGIHDAGRRLPGCAQQKTGRTAFADAACKLLIKMTVIPVFHILPHVHIRTQGTVTGLCRNDRSLFPKRRSGFAPISL